jgi:hypothetical protein
MIVTVVTAGEISSRLVAAVLAEADAIWRPNGVSFVWRRVPPLPAASQSIERAPYLSNTLRLTIGDERGAGHDGRLPLGWIVFDDVTVPQQEIYLSHANAQAMLDSASGVVGIVNQMPRRSARRSWRGHGAGAGARARPLSARLEGPHRHGLMKAVLTAVELFQPSNGALRIEPAQRRAVAARLRGEPLVASR